MKLSSVLSTSTATQAANLPIYYPPASQPAFGNMHLLQNPTNNDPTNNNNSPNLPNLQTQHNNHKKVGEAVRQNLYGSVLWRRSLSKSVETIEDNKHIDRYFHIKGDDDMTHVLDYYFEYLDSNSNSHSKNNNSYKKRRRRRRNTSANETKKVSGSDFIDYGCWCSRVKYLKFSGLNTDSSSSKLKGGEVIDEIDRACQDWTKCMRCVSISNSNKYQETQQDNTARDYQLPSCQFNEMTFVFGVQSSGELTCKDPINHVRSCAYETCECNLDLIKKFSKLRSSFDFENSRFSLDKERTCGYQTTPLVDENDAQTPTGDDTEMSNSGSSASGRTAFSSNQLFNEDSDFWNWEDDNKFEDPNYYDDTPASLGSLSGSENSSARPSSASAEAKEKVPATCCGTVPNWRPFRSSNRVCCNDNEQFWVAKKQLGACDRSPHQEELLL